MQGGIKMNDLMTKLGVYEMRFDDRDRLKAICGKCKAKDFRRYDTLPKKSVIKEKKNLRG